MLRKLFLALAATGALMATGIPGASAQALSGNPPPGTVIERYGPGPSRGGPGPGYRGRDYGPPRGGYDYGPPRGGYGYGPPRGGGYYGYGPPPRGPRCFYRPERVWDGWGYVVRERRICG